MAWRKVIWLCWAIWNHIQWPSDPGLAVSTRPLNLSVTAAGKTLQSRKPTRISVPFPSLTRKFSYIPFCSSPCFDLAPLSVVISLFYTQSHSSSLSFTLTSLTSYFILSMRIIGFPWCFSGEEFTCQCRRSRFNPWVRKIPWRRKRKPTPIFLPGKSHGQRNLVGYSP